MGGKEAVRQLLDLDPDLRAIVSSGYSDDPVMTGYRAYGFCAAMTKPYSMNDLKETISTALQQRTGPSSPLAHEPPTLQTGQEVARA